MQDHENLIIQEYRNTISKLETDWEEIGFDIESRMNDVNSQIKGVLSDIVDKETKYKRKLVSDIEKYGQEYYTLTKELGVEMQDDPAHTMTLLELMDFLRSRVDKMMEEVKKRNAHLMELQTEEQALCERLIEEPTEITRKTVPLKQDVEMLERKIRTLVQEKASREKNFCYLRDRIELLFEQLEHKPNNSFERDIFSDMELFTLSQNNIMKMKEMKEVLEIQVKKNEEECQNTRSLISLLWNRLEIDESERDTFLSGLNGSTPSSLLKLQDELKSLKQKQQQDIAKYINKLRREIEDWWEKCYIGDEEKEDFKPYFEDEYTDELLVLHDKEVARLSKYYEDHCDIITKLELRQKVWDRYMELEEKAHDPNRFGNRGGSLLREEKEMKKVKKELPFLEKELENLAHNRELEEGKPFLVSGMLISDYIQNEWCKYHDAKEQERKKKQNERINQRNYESVMGSKPPAVKRRIGVSDTLRKSKLQRIGEENPSNNLTSQHSKISSRSIVLRERNPNSTDTGSNISSYSSFKEGIKRRGERENVRSSAASSIMKTPCKPSPHRPPPGLPKTPKTVPRPPRCSPRLSGTKSARRSSRNTSSRIAFSPSSLCKSRNVTRINYSPSASPLFRSPRLGSSRMGMGSSPTTPSRWNKKTFLI